MSDEEKISQYKAQLRAEVPSSLQSVLGQFTALKFHDLWKQVCGPALCQVAQISGFRNEAAGKVMLLKIDDPLWKQEILFQKDFLLKKFTQEIHAQLRHDELHQWKICGIEILGSEQKNKFQNRKIRPKV